MSYFAWLNEQQEGPFDEAAIRKMISDRRIVKATLIYAEGGKDWSPAQDLFPEVSEDVSQPSPAAALKAPAGVPPALPPLTTRSVRWFSEKDSIVEIRL